MRFTIIVKATADSEAGLMSGEDPIAAMADFHEQLARAGVLLDAAGLQPSRQGWRVRHAQARRYVVDGPFAETKELVAGYTLIQVRSREEAREWTLRYPNPALLDGEIEVRPLYEVEDFGASAAMQRFRDMGLPSQQS